MCVLCVISYSFIYSINLVNIYLLIPFTLYQVLIHLIHTVGIQDKKALSLPLIFFSSKIVNALLNRLQMKQ